MESLILCLSLNCPFQDVPVHTPISQTVINNNNNSAGAGSGNENHARIFGRRGRMRIDAAGDAADIAVNRGRRRRF